MTDHGPLAGIEDIDWAASSHAYGPAADIPGQLTALLAPDGNERDTALHELYSSICHQGTRYEASAHAVPFLLAIAADPASPDRPAVLRLLSSLAIGYDSDRVPDGTDTRSWRRKVSWWQAGDPDEAARRLDQAVESAPAGRDRRLAEMSRSIFDFGRAQSLALAALAAYDAVRAGASVVSALLTDPDAAVRAGAAYILGWFPEQSSSLLPALLDRLDAEAVPDVMATTIVAAGLLSDDPHTDVFGGFLAHRAPVVRWAAATALARHGVASAAVLSELAGCAEASPPHSEPGIPYLDGDLSLYAAWSLIRFGCKLPPEDRDDVHDSLGTTWLVSPPAPPTPPDAEVTLARARALEVLADLDDSVWERWAVRNLLRESGLPDCRDGLRRYLAN